MLPRPRRPRLVLAVLAAAALLAALAGVAYRVVTDDPGDVVNPGVAFDEDARSEEPTPKPKRADRFHWPMYGYTKDHRRFYQPPKSFRGPWKRVWTQRGRALREFPPVIHRGLIIQLADDGRLVAIDKDTGRVRWRRRLGTLSASTPATSGASVYVTLLRRGRGSKGGRVAALKIRGGKIRWSRDLSSRSESSPMLHRGKIYFGSEGGTLYAMDAHNGKTLWRYRADGAIKGSPTLSNGVLYFGDYGGRVHAVRLRNGRKVWEASPASRTFGGGRFYATAALAFGRVYIGSTDGRMYSLSARDGKLAWARQTGDYVYASAAVRRVPGMGPTVFFGSYDGWFRALDARSGKTRWRFRSGRKISGSATIIGNVVYFADLDKKRTYGLGVRTGKRVFTKPYGTFDPVISDGRHLFVTGYSSLSAFLPRREVRRLRRERARERKERRERRRERRERRERDGD